MIAFDEIKDNLMRDNTHNLLRIEGQVRRANSYPKHEERWIKLSTNYDLSSYGRIVSKAKGSRVVMKSAEVVYVAIGDGKRKGYRLQRLVAEHFVPNPDNKKLARLIDAEAGYHADNIEWVNMDEATKGINTRLTEANIKAIRNLSKCGVPPRKLAKQFNVDVSTIKSIKGGVNFAWVK